MLSALRSYFFRKKLRSALQSPRRPAFYKPETARSITILFDASEEKNRTGLSDYAAQWQKKGKTVRLLGFFPDKNAVPSTAFDSFTAKELSWTGLPKNPKILAFSRIETDLLLVYNPNELLTLVWMAAAVPASMKIGTACSLPNDFDFQLEIPAQKGAAFFLDQLHLYLGKIVLTTTRHEHTVRAI